MMGQGEVSTRTVAQAGTAPSQFGGDGGSV